MDFAIDESPILAMRKVSSEFDAAYWNKVCTQGAFPSEYWEAISKSGLFGIMLGKEWGGMGRGIVDLALATEETAERYAGLGSYLYHSGALSPMIFANSASAQMKRKLLPAMSKGGLRVSIAMTEEDSGSDALSLETSAKKESDHFILSGKKVFVTNADRNDFLVLFARTGQPGEKDRAKGISAFLLDPQSKGVVITGMDKVGMDFNTACMVKLMDVRLSPDDLIGEIGGAWEALKGVFEMDRILTALSLVGTGKLALGLASTRAKERILFRKAIGSNQGIQFPLADAMAQLLASEAVALKAASLAEKGKAFVDWANIALLEAQAAAGAATDRAMQTYGGHGYLKGSGVERFWRDVRGHRFHPISEELLLSQIARRTLGLPGS